jgi:hypothetical protein
MKHSTRVKPIRYVKADGAELNPETLALLKILALGNREIEDGKVVPAAQAFRRAHRKAARR